MDAHDHHHPPDSGSGGRGRSRCCTISPRTASYLYPSLIVGSAALCILPLTSEILTFALVAAMIGATISLLCLPPTCCVRRADKYASLEGEEEGEHFVLPGSPPASLPPPRSSSAAPRLLYLDNLKSALTVLVVAHHAVGAMAGGGSVGLTIGNYASSFQAFGLGIQLLQQAYFMSFFFFISAYFTPGSYARKGARAFLADKFKRLGIPFLAYFFVLAPLLNMWTDQVVVGGRPVTYVPAGGPPWFVFWLLIFNTAYVMIQSEEEAAAAADGGSGSGGWWSAPMALPSLLVLVGLGATTGVLQALQMLFAPVYIMMPISFGSLPFDVLFFAGGILAAKNKWLDALPSIPTGQLVAARTVVVLFAGAVFGGTASLYAAGGGYGFLSCNACGSPSDKGGDRYTSLAQAIGVIAGIAVTAGVYAVCVSLAALDCGRRALNYSSGVSRFFAANAYAVYIIHPAVMVPVTYSFALIVEAAAGGDRLVYDGANASSGCLLPTGRSATLEGALLYVGLAYVLGVSLLICFPLAAALRRLPGVAAVL